MEGSAKLADELRNLVRNDMLKFSNEVKNSLTNVYKDLKGMSSHQQTAHFDHSN